jgi:uncharacterized surface protein with fasciclin (FAS1) repeats
VGAVDEDQRVHIIRRLAVAGALAVSVAACANAAPGVPAAPPSAAGAAVATSSAGAGPSASVSAAPPPEAAASGGVTTPAQVFGTGCSKLPASPVPGSLSAMAGQPVASAAAGNPLLTSLSTVVKKADLVDTLNTAPGITVFAPSDQAFADLEQTLGADRFNALLADQNTLVDLLKYHVLPRRHDRAALLADATEATMEGAGLRVSAAGPTIQVTDGAGRSATVLCGNIPTANATVFVIDKVLLRQQP